MVHARRASQEARAVFGGAEARAQRLAVERRVVDAADAPRGGGFVREGDVRRTGDERGVRLGRRGVDLQNLAELLEDARLAQRRLLAEAGRQADHVHQVASDHAHVEQTSAFRRGQRNTGKSVARIPRIPIRRVSDVTVRFARRV